MLVSHRTFWRLLDYPPSPPTPARQNKNQSPPYEESTVDHWLHHYMLLDLKVLWILKTIEGKTKQNRQVQKHKNRMAKQAMLGRFSRTKKIWKKREKKEEKKEEKKNETDVMLLVHVFLLDNNYHEVDHGV
ncbi:hypothetical protein VN97_g1099 [Penicillium thymicola]|uniref:Uncharacterized protein n=1 Tax=Penicillium thymicola TaxID=293382 RepID=A0AAI9XCD8_PENTH|nr:hypothetical protein VN97_g1099 [Penicillium thymicola]